MAFALACFGQVKSQVISRSEVLEKSKGANSKLVKQTRPKRGSVYSADGQTLAQSHDFYEFGINYRKVPHSPAFYADLSQATGISEADLRAPGQRGPREEGGQWSRSWRIRIAEKQAENVRNVQTRWAADGVSLDPVYRRSYPMGDLAAGVVGLMRETPVDGIELGLQKSLEGTAGETIGFVDRSGMFLPHKGTVPKQKVDGADVVLTIDSRLQTEAAEAVRAAVEAHKAVRGCAVVLDPTTGDVLAMANWPTYDPEGVVAIGEDLNMATMGRYQPGSIFKVFTVARALEEGKVTQSTTYKCVGSLPVSRARSVKCSHGAHGEIDLRRVIAESCNTACAQFAMDMGNEAMYGLIQDTGVLEKPPVPMPGLVKGHVDLNDPAKRIQTSNWGFGQAMVVSPLGMAAAFTSVANGGVAVQPHLVKTIGGVEQAYEKGHRVMEAETASWMLDLMTSTIQEDFGTGKRLRIQGYELAGKTGTAQKLGSGGGYMANFVGFVPAQEPRAVVLVMIDTPQGGAYYGGDVAGPVFKRIAESVLRHRSAPGRVLAAR